MDLRTASAEQAAYELAQPVEHNVAILVKYNPELYSEIKDVAGDSYYIRAMFDRTVTDVGSCDNFSQQLNFNKGDLLWVDNTIYKGVPGNWSAWLLDKEGNKIKWGLIPSKYKVKVSQNMYLQRRFIYFIRRSRKTSGKRIRASHSVMECMSSQTRPEDLFSRRSKAQSPAPERVRALP